VRPPGGLAPGLVAIKGIDQTIGVAQQGAHMNRRGGGTQRGHGKLHAVLGQRDYVHVAFDHDGAAGSLDRGARFEQTVKLRAFMEQRGFRRIEVFRLPLAEYPAAEADDLALDVLDGEHDAVAEAVVAPIVAIDDQAGGREGVRRVIGKNLFQRGPSIRRVTDADSGRRRRRSVRVVSNSRWHAASASTVFYRNCAACSSASHSAGGGLGRSGSPDSAPAGPRPGPAPRLRRKAHVLVFHQETERGAVCAAAEAVVELLGRADREGGCFFAVKGAAGLVVLPSFLQRHAPIDDVDDVDAGKQGVDEIARDHGCSMINPGGRRVALSPRGGP